MILVSKIVLDAGSQVKKGEQKRESNERLHVLLLSILPVLLDNHQLKIVTKVQIAI